MGGGNDCRFSLLVVVVVIVDVFRFVGKEAPFFAAAIAEDWFHGQTDCDLDFSFHP